MVFILILAVSLFGIAHSLQPRRADPNLQLHRALGQVVAEETTRLVRGKARIVVLTSDAPPTATMNAQIDAFFRTIRGVRGPEVIARRTVPATDKNRRDSETRISGVTFLRILQDYPNAEAIVSFAGVPYFRDPQLARLSHKCPKLIAVTRYNSQLRKLFQAQVMQVAIVDRFESLPPGSPKPQSPREWFNFYFQVVTPQNASSLPY